MGIGSTRSVAKTSVWSMAGLGLALLLCALIAPPVQAQNNAPAANAFQVSDVAVDATAASAAAARDVAMNQGHRKAFDRLIRRLVPRSSVSAVPNQSDAAISDLVSSVQVATERASTTRYIANLTFRFRPDRVRQMLVSAGVPMAEGRATPKLVLPLYQDQGTPVLWEESNPWWNAWDVVEFDREALVPLILPTGDAADQGVLTAAQATGSDTSRMLALARRYGASEVVVAEATRSGPNKVDLTLRSLGGAGETTVVETVTGSGDEAALFKDAATRAVARLEEDWKRNQSVRFDSQERLSVQIPLDGSLQSWVGIRNRLTQASVIQRVEVTSISRMDAQVVLHYFGSADQLVAALAQRNMELTQANGFWTLRPRGGG